MYSSMSSAWASASRLRSTTRSAAPTARAVTSLRRSARAWALIDSASALALAPDLGRLGLGAEARSERSASAAARASSMMRLASPLASASDAW
jgi:hypothetical protein